MSFQRGSQGTSGLASVKRDWSSESSLPSTSTAVSNPNPKRPQPQALTPEERQARTARRLAVLGKAGFQDGSSTSSTAAKRASDGVGIEPPSKRVGLTDTINGTQIQVQIQPPPAGSKPPPMSIAAQISLSSEQQEILKLVTSGKNIFFTGSAGTGKSVLLREIIRALKKKYIRSPDAVAITASTGMAACNIGGITLHSFSGAGLALESAETLANKIKKQKKAASRWLRTQVLIIDEISMVDAELFDKLARIACLIRKSTKPFGGIQLVVCGDFFQLPPVAKNAQAKFAFEAEFWSDCVERTFNLTKVFRQKEQIFVDMLNEMRFGALTQKSINKFNSLSRPIDTSDGIEPTELFPLREQVERSNERRLHSLQGEIHTYTAADSGTAEPEQRAKLTANMMAPARLALKVDTQVMLIKNVDETLVNGSVGKVIGFYDTATYTKMQMQMDIGVLEDEEPKDAKGKSKKAPAGLQVFPLVKFVIPGGGTRDVLVASESWKVELPTGEVQAARQQLPLILAWAMSIHKSQGQTLPKVKVDLTSIFEKGQAYVALSRATSLDGLQVLGFHPSKVMAHPKVAKWSKTLETIN